MKGLHSNDLLLHSNLKKNFLMRPDQGVFSRGGVAHSFSGMCQYSVNTVFNSSMTTGSAILQLVNRLSTTREGHVISLR